MILSKRSRACAAKPNAFTMTITTTRRLHRSRRHHHACPTHNTCLFSVLSLILLTQCPTSAFSPCPFTHPHSFTPTPSCLFANTGSPVKNALFTQVISDVDDTLKSSGGVNVAGVALGGIDVQYERGEYYPGVAQFMLELSRGPNSPLTKTPPKVAILTARAEEFKMALELKDTSSLAVAFRQAGEASGILNWGLGPVLYGSVAEWVLQTRKGLRKFNNFERLLQQDPTGTILQVRVVLLPQCFSLMRSSSHTILLKTHHLLHHTIVYLCG